jgi:hypothetical protein
LYFVVIKFDLSGRQHANRRVLLYIVPEPFCTSLKMVLMGNMRPRINPQYLRKVYKSHIGPFNLTYTFVLSEPLRGKYKSHMQMAHLKQVVYN